MRALLFTAALLLLTGCSAGPAADEVADAAARFATASPEQACAQLAPDTRARFERDHGDCAAALGALDLRRQPEVLAVDLAGQSAQARLPGEVLFLARFPDGWLVTAAGCSRDPAADPSIPYQCEVAP